MIYSNGGEAAPSLLSVNTADDKQMMKRGLTMPDRFKKMISRRSLLERAPVAAAAAVSLDCLTSGGAVAQQDKLSHALSKYQDTPKNGQQCTTCTHFVAPASCAIVVDPIAPQGWCQFYVKP